MCPTYWLNRRCRPRTKPPTTPVFGGLTAKAHEQGELFRSRLEKLARHLRRWPTRQGITCYRLYERDIPEIPLIVDRYEDHLHIAEYERPHERDLAQHADWLDLMARTAAEALQVDRRQVFLKRRLRQRGTLQHEHLADQQYEITVHEGGLQFLVNLSDYVDTGLFLDHRITRSIVRELADGARVLNLFGYTGGFLRLRRCRRGRADHDGGLVAHLSGMGTAEHAAERIHESAAHVCAGRRARVPAAPAAQYDV